VHDVKQPAPGDLTETREAPTASASHLGLFTSSVRGSITYLVDTDEMNIGLEAFIQKVSGICVGNLE
jgi:hypothetical protein